MFILAIWLLFTVVTQSPGEKELLRPDAFFPLVFGFQHRFHISYNNALVIAAFPIFATAIIYFYLVMKQVKAMASSNLLPRFLLNSFQYESYNFPLVASFLLCVFAFSANYFVSTVNILTTSARMAGLATCVVYLSMFYCYVIFKRRYGHMERCFTNPLGMISPILGSCIFLFLLIIIVAFNLEYKSVTICYTIYMTVMLLYYYLYAESRQCFSLQEQQVFFRAYIVKSKDI
jgi:amino acid transporter